MTARALLGNASAPVLTDFLPFVEWMNRCDPNALVPGTSTSLRDSAHRFFDAVSFLLTRSERCILVVAHAPALRWIVQAAQRRTDPLNYRDPLFGHADPLEVDVLALRSRLDALATDPFVVFSGQPRKQP
jgi:hypothetical protein